jgi:uncharacterized LabA/DUF88 family protein
MKNEKTYKPETIKNIDMNPGDPKRLPDEFFLNANNQTLIFIDDGFLSKLSKFFGKGKYIKIHRKKFSEQLAKKENLIPKNISIYTAPPFQSKHPNKEEELRKKGYDKFVNIMRKEGIIIKEGRCQRLKINGKFVFKQKGVDTHLIMDLMQIPYKHKEIKKIILIASDSDFVPIIKALQEENIKVILYTYFEKKRNKNFSTSNDLIKSVHKYVLLNKEDFKHKK